MAKNKVVRPLTEEQRKRIMDRPGVIVHRRDPSVKGFPFVPTLRVERPISVRELLGRDDDSDDEDPSE